jgi:hypothetical protein
VVDQGRGPPHGGKLRQAAGAAAWEGLRPAPALSVEQLALLLELGLVDLALGEALIKWSPELSTPPIPGERGAT